MTQPWSKEIDDELKPGMARLFASDNSESIKNHSIDSDKNMSERIKYGSSVNHQGSERTQSKAIFNINNHVNSKQEKFNQNKNSLKEGLKFNPKIQSNRALSSMLRKIHNRQNDTPHQNKFSNVFNENPSQSSNIQGMSNQISNNIYPNQEKSSSPKSSFQKSNYTGNYPIPPPPKLPPEGREIPPFLSFGSDEGINPYQINHKNPYDSTLTDALSESITGNKRFSSNDVRNGNGNDYQEPLWNNNYSNNTFQNNQNNLQNRPQNPNVYHKSRIDQVNQLNHLKRVNLRNQTTSLFTNTQNQESMNREPSNYSSRENNYENSSKNGFGFYNNRANGNKSNQFENFIQKSNRRQNYNERNGQNQFTNDFNDSLRSNSQNYNNSINRNNNNNFGSLQPDSRNFQNSNTRDNFHRKTLSLKERLYKPTLNNSGFQGYSQENKHNIENNYESPFQVENAKFQNDQQDHLSNFSQNNSLQNSLQDDLLYNTENKINEIEEEPEQREISIIENLHYIEQAEPVKLEVLRILMDRNKHPDCQLLRKIKRNRYMGSVALGMILYNLIETFGSDMISKNYEEGNDIYHISERFSGLIERAFNI